MHRCTDGLTHFEMPCGVASHSDWDSDLINQHVRPQQKQRVLPQRFFPWNTEPLFTGSPGIPAIAIPYSQRLVFLWRDTVGANAVGAANFEVQEAVAKPEQTVGLHGPWL